MKAELPTEGYIEVTQLIFSARPPPSALAPDSSHVFYTKLSTHNIIPAQFFNVLPGNMYFTFLTYLFTLFGLSEPPFSLARGTASAYLPLTPSPLTPYFLLVQCKANWTIWMKFPRLTMLSPVSLCMKFPLPEIFFFSSKSPAPLLAYLTPFKIASKTFFCWKIFPSLLFPRGGTYYIQCTATDGLLSISPFNCEVSSILVSKMFYAPGIGSVT